MTGAVEAEGALGLFLELAAISSASRRERPVTDVCIAYLRDLGLEPREGLPPLPGDDAGNVFCRIPATAGESGAPILLPLPRPTHRAPSRNSAKPAADPCAA